MYVFQRIRNAALNEPEIHMDNKFVKYFIPALATIMMIGLTGCAMEPKAPMAMEKNPLPQAASIDGRANIEKERWGEQGGAAGGTALSR
jgi:hypothetical protein